MGSGTTLAWREVNGNLSMVAPDGTVLYTIPKESQPVSIETTAQLVKDLGVDTVNLIFDTRANELNRSYDTKIAQATSAQEIARLELERASLNSRYHLDRMGQWQEFARYESGSA